MDSSHHAHSLKPTESIPLRTRSSSSPENGQSAESSSEEEDSYPDSDAAYLRRHHAHAAHSSGDTLTTSLVQQTVVERLLSFIMSKTPLLSRSSPALRTGSYGAVPITHSRRSSNSSQASAGETDDVRRRDKRKYLKTSRSIAQGEASMSATIVGRQHVSQSRRRGRTSSQTSELGMGMESKASYAGGGPLPQSFLDDDGGSSNISSAATSPGSSSQCSRRPSHSEEDPIDNSPYPQVRASVRATDNITLSISTPRMWTLSLLFALTGSAVNIFFSLRYPSVAITPVIALVLVHPLGKVWDLLLKRHEDLEESFVDGIRQSSEPDGGSVKHRFRLWLAQGRWNEKEHACVYISSNVSFGFAFATDVIVEQHKFYKQDVSIVYQLLLTISTQILGYAFAGLTRRFLVRPAAMIWPGTLMSTAMFTTMHKQENEPANGWKISRYRFFLYVWAGAFAWYFLPGLLFPALSYFNVITWFAPKNVVVANLACSPALLHQHFQLTDLQFGVVSGLGLFPMTFDWAQIAYIGSPLLTPWWAAANVVGGLVLVMWIVAPILCRNRAISSLHFF
jgi:OPT oligopeptide transporter protein